MYKYCIYPTTAKYCASARFTFNNMFCTQMHIKILKLLKLETFVKKERIIVHITYLRKKYQVVGKNRKV